MRLRDLSIERKFFLVIVPLCLIPTALLMTLFIQGSHHAMRIMVGQTLAEKTDEFRYSFDRYLESRLAQFQQLVADLDADADTQDLLVLGQKLGEHSLADMLIFADGKGVQVHVINNSSVAAGVRHHIDLTRYELWARESPPPPDGALTDLRISLPGYLTPVVLAEVAFPVGDNAVVVLVTDAPEFVRQFLQTRPIPPDFLVAFSSSGNTIFRKEPQPSDYAEQLSPNPFISTPETHWRELFINGRAFIFAHAASHIMRQRTWPAASGWYFVMNTDLAPYMESQSSLVWLTVLVALAMILVLMAVSTWLGRLIVRPLHVLKQQAGQLAAGNLNVRAPADRRDEIGELAGTFNRMAAQLQRTYGELERRLAENRLRTEHINAINEIAHASLQAQDVSQIFVHLTRDLRRIVPFDAIWLCRYDAGDRFMRLMEIHPPHLRELPPDGRIPLANSLHGAVMEHGETLRAEIGPHQRADFFETCMFAAEGYQSYLLAPLPSRQGIAGVFGLASTSPDVFTAELAEVISSLAGAIGIALEQSEAFEQLSRFAGELERKVMERTEELHQTRLKLTQAEKYFALGRLAANLAHEINNPLGIIKNYLQLVSDTLQQTGGGRRSTDPNIGHIQIINEEVDRIAKLVRNLLDLHRPVEQNIQPVDINRMIDEILALLEESLRSQSIRVERRPGALTRHPLISPDLMRQVLINVIRNSQDAMEDGGTLTVETGQRTDASGTAEELVIRIIDTGCGIAPEHISQVFDPFFTTKPQDRGTGLGLCVSYSIMHLYDGNIEIASTPGKGTTVTLTLPLHRGNAATVSTSGARLSPAAPGEGD